LRGFTKPTTTIEGVPNTSAQRCQIVDLIGHIRALRGWVVQDQTILKKIRQGNVGLSTKNQLRGKHVVVTHL
jgi:hypothetical protein